MKELKIESTIYLFDSLKELPKEINNETDISELINIVISNIKKLLINLINKQSNNVT